MDIFFGQFAVALDYLTSQEKQLNKEIKLLNRQINNYEILLNTLDTNDPRYNDISENRDTLRTELSIKETELDAVNNEIENFKDNASYGGAANIITSPTFNRNLVYNGTPQQLVSNVGYAIGGTIQFRLSTQEEYSSDIPTVTNAGSYYVYYKAIGVGGREDSEEVEINVNISKANLTIIPPTAIENLTYNGQEQELINRGIVNGLLQLIEYSADGINYSRSIPKAQNVGSYTIYWRIYTAGINTYNYNYNENDANNSGQINVNINKGNYNITVTVDNCIEGNIPNVNISGLETYDIERESCTIEYKKSTDPDTAYSTDVPTEIGNYNVKVQIAGNNNYNDFEKTVQFRIMSENTTVPYNEYFWYIGSDNPMNSDSISSIVDPNSTLPGWRHIGNTLGTYSRDNKLWDGDNHPIEFPNGSEYYIALPSESLKLYNTGGANEMEKCTLIGNKQINGDITYYVYQRVNDNGDPIFVYEFGFNIY